MERRFVTSYRSLFQVREFRFLYGAQTLSLVGDQLAAIAVAVLVFDRTGSGLLTAVAYASGWLPAIVGGPLLAPYADRLPRRAVMIVCDMARAGLVAVLAWPGTPLFVAIGLMYVVSLVGAPFTAARSALLVDVLTGEAYITGNGLGNITFRLAQIGGFATGGITVTLLNPHRVLLIDAVTFAASAVLVWAGVRPRPAAATTVRRSVFADSRAGLRYVFADPWLRGCLLLVWVASAFAYGPEAIMYPYARDLDRTASIAGLMLTAPCLGYVLGAWVLTRVLTPPVRDALLAPAAVLSTVVLIPALLNPPLPALLALLAVLGTGASFAAPLNAVFARRVDPAFRGRAMGVAISGLLAVQGLAFLVAGQLADLGLRPSTITGLFGVAGTAAVLSAAAVWRKTTRVPGGNRDAETSVASRRL
jgi:predicted MFS family arabinose efflux permease